MKIQDIKIIFICPDHNEKYNKRKIHMEELLRTLGCSSVIHYKSGTDNYPHCVTKACMEILSLYIDEPILILEDDVESTNIFEFPLEDDTDAIYLGISKSGGHPTENRFHGYSVFHPYDNTLVKVRNMLSGHAVVYNSKRYKQKVIEVFSKCLENNYYPDVMLSRIQDSFKVFAPRVPLFYQSSKFNPLVDVERITKIKINDDMTTCPL